MDYDWKLLITGALYFLSGLYLIALGLWGLVYKRPLVMQKRFISWIEQGFLIITGAALVWPWVPVNEDDGPLIILMISMFVFGSAVVGTVFYIGFRRNIGSYKFYGINGARFREDLLRTLKTLHYRFEDSASEIELTDINAVLEVPEKIKRGTAEIRIKPSGSWKYLKTITGALETEYRYGVTHVTLSAFVGLLLEGLALFAIFAYILLATDVFPSFINMVNSQIW